MNGKEPTKPLQRAATLTDIYSACEEASTAWKKHNEEREIERAKKRKEVDRANLGECREEGNS